jgi:hypothetical protein|tara:strand:- start:259 stop:837 length:579 start_codon:yes stop_codon:yes gene_type:complete
MISTKKLKIENMGLTPDQRKAKVLTLRKMHEDYFQTEGKINAQYIPKMAYRPKGKDELHVSFFPSELDKDEDIYTEFVSIDYDSEDPKRTLYLHKYNPHWKSEYELVTSGSGFQRHLIPVSELKVINDITSKSINISYSDTGKAVSSGIKQTTTLFDLPNPDGNSPSALVDKLEEINQTLITLTKVINKFNN